MSDKISNINASFIAAKLGLQFDYENKDKNYHPGDFVSMDGKKLNKTEKKEVSSLNKELQSYDPEESRRFFEMLDKKAITIKQTLPDTLHKERKEKETTIKVSGYVDFNQDIILDPDGAVVGKLDLYSSIMEKLGRGTGEDGSINVRNYLVISNNKTYVGRAIYDHQLGYQSSSSCNAFLFIENNKFSDNPKKVLNKWATLEMWSVAYREKPASESFNVSVLKTLIEKKLMPKVIETSLNEYIKNNWDYLPDIYVLANIVKK